MVFHSACVAAVANLSADLCQYVACNPQRLPSGEVLRLLCCLPLHHLGRLALRLFSFFCFPVDPPSSPARFRYRYRGAGRWSSSTSSSSSSSSEESDLAGYDSHSD